VLTRVLAAALFLGGLIAITTPTTPAMACDHPVAHSDPLTGKLTYSCDETTPGGGGGSGTSGSSGSTPAQPTCDLSSVPGATWCRGTQACYTKPTLPPLLLATGPKPQPDSQSMTDWCGMPAGIQGTISPVRTYWSDSGTPPPPSLADQAATAVGSLQLGLPALSTSPLHRTLVTVPTWFWVDGAPPTQTGSSAFGLMAIATVSSLNITTGDGATLTCPWTNSAQQASTDCQHAYTQASYDGTASWDGRPAYAVSAAATWSIRFEMNGVGVNIPGAPTSLTGPASTAVLRVDEVQTVVTDAR